MAMSGANPVNFTGVTAASGNRPPAQAQQAPGHDYGADGLAGSVSAPPSRPTQQAAPARYASGLQMMKDQQSVALQALIPAGLFVPCEVFIDRAMDGSVQAKIAGPNGQPTMLPTQQGSDGNIYVQVESNNPRLLVLDPNKAEFGVTSPFQQQGSAVVREQAQMVGADGTLISIFNEVQTHEGKESTQVFQKPNGGAMWAAKVTEQPNHDPNAKSGWMKDAGRAFGIGGPNTRQEEPLKVKGNAHQGYDVSGASLWAHGAATGKNGFNSFFDFKGAPLWKWLDGRKQQAVHLTPFTAMPGPVFPSLGAMTGAPAPAQAAPFAPPQPPSQGQAAPFAPPQPPHHGQAAPAPGGPPNPPGPAPEGGPVPGPAPQPDAALMGELQKAINAGDMAKAQAIMDHMSGRAPQPQAPPPQASAVQPPPVPPQTAELSRPTVGIQIGDLMRQPADCILTAVNGEGEWRGGIDNALRRTAGNQFHDQARVLVGGQTGQGMLAEPQSRHSGAFTNVGFVVDNLDKPLYDVVSAALDMADAYGQKSVAMPTMRLGAMAAFGGAPEEKIADMARAVKDFQARATSVKDIQFVVQDRNVAQQLHNQLQAAPAPPQAAPAPPQAAPAPPQAAPAPPQAAPAPQSPPPTSPAPGFDGVQLEAFVPALMQGDAGAQQKLAAIQAKAQTGDQAALAFLQQVDALALELGKQVLTAAEGVLAQATPEEMSMARAALARVQGGDQSEFNSQVQAAQGGDPAATKWIDLVQSVAVVDGHAAGQAAAAEQAQQKPT